MRNTLAILTALVLSFALPAGVAARAALHGIPSELRGGERVEIRWSGLDPDVHEVELELSLGGARWVRISPEMEALEGGYTWLVPSGLAGPARIRLRAGGEQGEREVAEQSLCFVAESGAGPGASLATPGWWDLGPDHGPAPAGLFGPRGPVLSPGGESAEAVIVSVPGPARAQTAERADAHRGEAACSPHVRSRGFRAPRQAPLRN